MKNELASLNERCFQKISQMLTKARELDLLPGKIGDALVVDAGLNTRGCLSAAEQICEVSLADLGQIRLETTNVSQAPNLALQIIIDFPMAACLGSQYSYWTLPAEFPQGRISGPSQLLHPDLDVPSQMRETLGKNQKTVLVLESQVLPDERLVAYLSESLKVSPANLIILLVPPSQMTGVLLEASRAVTYTIKLLEHHGYKPGHVVGATGKIPVPPPTPESLIMARRQKDAMIYGAGVILYVRGENDAMGALAESIAAPSKDEDHSNEPLRPAEWVIHNVETGNSLAFGRLEHELMLRTFYA